MSLKESLRTTYFYLIQCHDDYQCFFEENLAFGKNTDQYYSTAHGGFSRLAVDGNSETDFYKGSCTHTDKTSNPWWRVDLGQIEPVSEVYIVNWANKWFYRQGNFEIRVGR